MKSNLLLFWIIETIKLSLKIYTVIYFLFRNSYYGLNYIVKNK